MAPLLNREEIEQTKSLAEAVYLLFGVYIVPRGITHIFNWGFEERFCLFKDEAMEGEIARAYDTLGRTARKDTYRRIVEDFKTRVHYSFHSQKSILDVGCGSGLLSLELAIQTNEAIIGLDLSEDMITLAENNCKKLVPKQKRRIHFVQGNVYDLDKIITEKETVDYIICRNALHRFQYPEIALQQMYRALAPTGKIYLRDLRRDAPWPTVLKRIDEKRWKYPVLVRDYIGAMAQMLTMKELRELLISLDINNFEITDSGYVSNRKKAPSQTINEYAAQVEYVCVIKKT